MFFATKVYLHLNCVLMLYWIVWNGTVFDIETVLSLNWIVIYKTVLTFYCVNKKSVLMLTWICWIRTVLTIKLCTHAKLNCLK